MRYFYIILLLLIINHLKAQNENWSIVIGETNNFSDSRDYGCSSFFMEEDTLILAYNYLESGTNGIGIVKLDGNQQVIWEKKYEFDAGLAFVECLGSFLKKK